jgi:dienelactone hydrolase
MTSSRPGTSHLHGAVSRPVLFFSVFAGFLLALPAFSSKPAYFRFSGLDPGPYAVGLKVVQAYDHQRTMGRPLDYEGNPNAGEIDRPLLVLVWYPARGAEEAAPLTYGDLVDLSAREMAFGTPTAGELAETREAFLADALARGAPREELEALFSRPTTACRDAPPAEGTFPLILYAPSWNGPASENSVLCEFLASHGYVVAASASVGATAREMTLDAAGLDAQVRDLEFLLALLRGFPGASGESVGVAGFSWGGLADVAAAAQNSRIRAVASLDGSLLNPEGIATVERLPGFDPRAFQVPLLVVRSGDSAARGAPNLIDAMKYATLLDVALLPLAHRDFCSRFQLTYALSPALEKGRARTLIDGGYELVCRLVLRFMDSNLKGDASARAFLAALPSGTGVDADLLRVYRRPALKPPPTEGQFLAILLRDGLERARGIYEEAAKADPGCTVFREETLNRVGYRYLARGWAKDAEGVFELNTLAYPSSANAWDSLAEACVAAGDGARAAQAARMVLQLLPRDKTLSEAGKAQLKRRAEALLEKVRREK